MEICINKSYGAICDDFWDTQDARVACILLGFTNGSCIFCDTYELLFLGSIDSQPLSGLNISDQRIYLDNVQCAGNEGSLLDCRSNSIGEHNCGQSDGAGVRCEGNFSI